MTNDIDSIQYIMYMSKKLHKEIGFIGLGIMGKPMVKNLLKSGYAVYFYARKKRVIDEIKKLGGKYFVNIGELPKVCKIIILNLPESKDVKEVILSKHGLWKNISKDTTIIDMSTISPDVTVSISKKLKKLKVHLIDAPVSGGEIGAIKGNLSIMVGGEKSIFNKIKPILGVLGKNITYIGKSGSGQIAKACNQILVAETMVAVSEILLLAKKTKCDLKLIREALMGGFANSKILDLHGQRMIEGNYKPGFKVGLHLKDLNIAVELAKKSGLRLNNALYARKLMRAANYMKLQNKDSSIINKIIQDYNK